MNNTVNHLQNKFWEAWNNNKKKFCFSVAATFIWGMIAHAYMFSNSAFTHDSLAEINSNLWKIQIGRVFIPAYQSLSRGIFNIPWLNGILALLYIAIAVFLVVKIFDMHSYILIAATAGIFSCNITVIALTATYIHDLDTDMLALLLAVLAVYFWKFHRKGYLYGSICIMLSLGLYQAYVSVTVTLVILSLIFSLFDGEKFKNVFVKGTEAIVLLLCGGLLYIVSVKGICKITDIALLSGNYNSLNHALTLQLGVRGWLDILSGAYKQPIERLLNVPSVYPHKIMLLFHVFLFLTLFAVLCVWMKAERGKIKEKLLVIALVAVLPFGMNISYILSAGIGHDLVQYAFWLFYLYALLFVWKLKERWNIAYEPFLKCWKALAVSLIFVVLWGNVQIANIIYLKKDLTTQAMQVRFAEVMASVEHMDGYIAGETPIVFAGDVNKLVEPIPAYMDLDVTGWDYFLGNYDNEELYLSAYFSYILQDSAVLADKATCSAIRSMAEVEAMPIWPKDGSICMINGILVVKVN